MTRVPLGDLRAAFANPSKYVRSFTPGSKGGGPSKYGMFLHAIGVFHRSGNLSQAQDYLEEKLTQFKTFSDLPEYVRMLDTYAREFRRQENSVVRYRDNITIMVPGIQSVVVSGQAFRVDLARAGGYAVWMFVRDASNWANDPKMPLLHSAYAETLDTPLEDVTVGVYDFEVGAYASRQYSTKEINNAKRSLKNLLQALSSRLARKS